MQCSTSSAIEFYPPNLPTPRLQAVCNLRISNLIAILFAQIADIALFIRDLTALVDIFK